MAFILALHKTPADIAAFDAHFDDVHTPLAKSIPGIRSVEVSDGPVMTPEGPAPYHRVGLLRFDSLADLQAGMGSPEGMAAAADLANFSTGGFDILIFDSHET
ncbi:MAG TPA: EthD family reductase [Longimicrobium sp.]